MSNNILSRKDQTIAKNTVFLYFRQILTMLVALYTSRVVLDVLGIDDYGVYSVVGGMVTMFAFLNTSLSQATQRFIAFGLEKDTVLQQKQTFSMLLNVHLIISIIVFILCETIGLWLFYNKLVIPIDRIQSAFWVMQCSIFTLMVSITQVPYNASIFAHERMNVYTYISIFEVILKLILVLILKFFFEDKLVTYAILLMCAQIIVATIYRIYCIRKFNNCHYLFYWSKDLFKQVFSFSSWSILGNLAYTLNTQGMNILINIFFGPIYNAAKGIANSVEAAINPFVTNFLSAVIPPIIKTFSVGDMSSCMRLHYKSSKFGFYLYMVMAMPLISIIDPLLSIWLVEVPAYASLFSVLSIIYIQITTMGGTLQNIVQAVGNVKFFQLSNGVLKLFPIAIVYFLFKIGSPVESYLYVLIIISIISIFIQIIAVKKTLPEYSIKKFITIVIMPEIIAFIIPCIVSLSIYFSRVTVLLSFFLSLCCAILVFIITLLSIWFLGLTKSEKLWLKNFIYIKFNIK